MPQTARKVHVNSRVKRKSNRGRKPSVPVTEEQELKQKYLEVLKRVGYSYHAAKTVGITPKILHRWLEEDPAFAMSYQEIVEELEKLRLNDLEAAAFQRALARSDQLMKFLLASLDPRYRDRIEQKGGITISFSDNVVTEEEF
jgi:hypothetical protein